MGVEVIEVGGEGAVHDGTAAARDGPGPKEPGESLRPDVTRELSEGSLDGSPLGKDLSFDDRLGISGHKKLLTVNLRSDHAEGFTQDASGNLVFVLIQWDQRRGGEHEADMMPQDYGDR